MWLKTHRYDSVEEARASDMVLPTPPFRTSPQRNLLDFCCREGRSICPDGLYGVYRQQHEATPLSQPAIVDMLQMYSAIVNKVLNERVMELTEEEKAEACKEVLQKKRARGS